jgi:hypothetical protein
LLPRRWLNDYGVFVGGDRDKELTDGDLHSFFDVNLANGAGLRGWNGAHRLLGFQFYERLVFFDLLSLGNQNTDDDTRIYALS